MDFSPCLAHGFTRTMEAMGCRRRETFRAKALQAINASQQIAVGTGHGIGSPTHAHGQAAPEVEEKQRRLSGPQSAREGAA